MSKSDIAVSVRGLSKAYTIAHEQEKHSTLAETMLARLKNPLQRPKTETFWALKDINFDIKKGDVVGIIGRNGAGKSTLLKILSRITEPSTGRIDLYGRVGSLLEVGTGFHPELTGRENIFLNGAILGMTRDEVRSQFDAIVDFSGVEKFLDTPVKRFSSGMYVRLAFAVAAHLNPEILIVDEVLAVGDTAFQKKCLGVMQKVGQSGRTVLFVSHNMSVIQTLCSSCVTLRNGELVNVSPSADAVQFYLNEFAGAGFDRPPQRDGIPTIVRGSVIGVVGERSPTVRLSITIVTTTSNTCSLDFRITDRVGANAAYASVGSMNYGEMIKLFPGETQVTVGLDASSLAIGTYLVSLDLTDPNVRYFDRVENILSFEISRTPAAGADRVLSQLWGYGSYELKVLDVALGRAKGANLELSSSRTS